MLNTATATVSVVEAPTTQAQAARAAGIPKSTYNARLQRGRVEDTLATLTETLRIQGLALERLLTPTPPPVVPVHEPEVARVLAEAKADGNVVDALGKSSDYDGEIYGCTVKRRPLIGAPASATPIRILAVGDTHFHPAILDRTRRVMTLVGLQAASGHYEHLVHIGDVSDLASVCRHVRNDTWKAREKPSIRQDFKCMASNMAALNAPLVRANVAIKKHVTKGNHCAWLSAFEDDTPELKGHLVSEFDGILEDCGWTHSDYGEFYYVGDVGFVHVPLNLMGRPVGGQTGENTIAMQSTRDTVFGHTHRYGMARRGKMDGRTVTALNVGSSMPEYYVGEYAQLTAGRKLDYGCTEITVFDGRIQSHRFLPFRELEATHGVEADAILRRTA